MSMVTNKNSTSVIQDATRQDKFGYYRVGDLKFYSKLEAFEIGRKTNQTPTWHFNDEVYSSYNWTVEPAESLSELYRCRAQQLRDEYDYLVLFLSGGADSKNILKTFIDNDIKLDEVVSHVNYEATGSKTNPLAGEIFHQAIPLAEAAQKIQPGLKYRLLDTSKLMLDIFKNNTFKYEWIYQNNAHLSPNQIVKQDLKLTVPEWVTMFDSGKKVAFINGIDKPAVAKLKDKYYCRFYDIPIDVGATPYQQQSNRPWEFNELFYWTPDCPKIVIKQAHAVKNYLESNPSSDNFMPDGSDLVGGSVVIISPEGKKILKQETLNYIIYPGHVTNPWQVKSPSLVVSNKDTWFFNQSELELARKYWRIGIEEFYKIIGKDTSATFNSTLSNVEYHQIKPVNSIPYYFG